MTGSGQGKEDVRARAIFISYRRDDSEGEAGRLYDDLVRAYGDDSVFMDVAGIEPGLDFRQAIDANVSSCGVLLAMIGPTWASVTDSSGARRLDSSSDFVRLEIASALARKIAVIPVLVHGARMPALDQLPEDLKDLRYRNSVELTHARWNSDVALLVTALKSYVTVNVSREEETVHATVPVQLPAPMPAQPLEAPAKSKTPLLIGVAAAVLIVLALAYFAGGLVDNLFPPKKQQQQAQDGVMLPAGADPGKPVSAGGVLNPIVRPLLGRWKAVAEPPAGDDLNRIEVSDAGGRLVVHAWGKCPSCDWGSRTAMIVGSQAVTPSWELRNTTQESNLQRSVVLILQAAGSGLQVTVRNTFHEPNGNTRVNANPLQFAKD